MAADTEVRKLGTCLAASLVAHAAVLGLAPRPHVHPRDVPPVPLTVEILPAPPAPSAVTAPSPSAVPPAVAIPAPAREPPASAPKRREARTPQRTPPAPASPPVVAAAPAPVPAGPPAVAPPPVAPAPVAPLPNGDSGPRPAPGPSASGSTASARADGPTGAAPAETASRAPVVVPPAFGAAYLRNPPPRYPLDARREGAEGTVLLRVWVSADGAPTRVEMQRSSGHRSLDEVALATVRNWRFVPAQRAGEAVEGVVSVPLVFRLEAAGDVVPLAAHP